MTATISSRVRDRSSHQPKAPAVSVACESGTRTVTYGELVARADRWAAVLAGRGVRAETRVAVALPRGPEAVTAFLAVLTAGGTFVPLDPDHPEQRREFVLEDADVALVLTDDDGAPGFAGRPVLTVAAADAGAGAFPEPADRADGAAYIIYTSGSTGQPKGVVVEHTSVISLISDDPRIAVAPGERVAQLAPTAFDASVFELWGALCRGGHVIVMDPRVGVGELGAQLRHWEPHWVFLTTGLFHLLAQYDPAVFDTVGRLLTGGDVLSPQRIGAAASTRAEVYAAYGPTEATVFSSLHAVPASAAVGERVPIGTAVGGRTMRVLGPDLRELPAGEIGEIYIGGRGVARGYHRRPGLTAARFVADTGGGPGARMYRTGDLGCLLPDGAIDFRGRVDRQVKVRGFRVEPGEIEATLLRCPDIGDAVVVAVDGAVDGTAGAAEKRLAAYVVAETDRPVTVSAVREWLADELPAHMLPATFVVLDELPLDPNGKPDRSQLPAPFAAREALTFLPPLTRPSTELEQLLVQVWAEVLTLDEVGVDDDFFLLGGDSLRSVAVLEMLRGHGIELDAGQFFTNPTIRELALVVEEEAGLPAGAPVAIRAG